MHAKTPASRAVVHPRSITDIVLRNSCRWEETNGHGRYTQKYRDLGTDFLRGNLGAKSNISFRMSHAVFLQDEEGGSSRLPPRVALWKEGTVPLGPHFPENARGAGIGDRISRSVLEHREGSGGSRKTDLRCEIRRICGIGRSRTKVHNFTRGCPGDVKRRRRVVRSWSTDKDVVDCALFGQMDACRPTPHEERIVWNRNNPEQT